MNPTIRTAIRSCAGLATCLVLASPLSTARERSSEPPELPFGEADLFFELNNTDGDLGIHAKIGGDDWKNLSIESPNDTVLLQIIARGGLRRQGMSEFLFESAEPKFSDLAPADFLRRFPEGTYDIEAITLDGGELESEVEISHVIPAPAVPLSPAQATCDAPVVVSAPVTLRWNPVTRSHPTIGTPNQPVEVDRYEVSIEKIDGSGLKMFAELPADVTSFAVPELFTRAAGTVKFQILVKATSGNRTGEESCFAIR